MNTNETRELITAIHAINPNHYQLTSKSERDRMVVAWTDLLADVNMAEARDAVTGYYRANPDAYPVQPGEIIRRVTEKRNQQFSEREREERYRLGNPNAIHAPTGLLDKFKKMKPADPTNPKNQPVRK